MTRTALQAIVEEAAPGPFMLRRLAQQAMLVDRGFSYSQVAKKLDLSKEAVNQYFRGNLWKKDDDTARDGEDAVERAIEELTLEKGITFPTVTTVVGPEDSNGIPDVVFTEAYVPEITTRELMRKPS